jgi:hypothetical protein
MIASDVETDGWQEPDTTADCVENVSPAMRHRIVSLSYLPAMIQHLAPVPFTIAVDPDLGMQTELQGILTSDGINLIIEYRITGSSGNSASNQVPEFVSGVKTSQYIKDFVNAKILDTMFGVAKSELKELSIPLADVWTINFEQKWFGMRNHIVIQFRRQQLLNDLPESTIPQGLMKCTIERKDRQAAEAFCLEASQLVMRFRNLRLEDEIDRRELE